VGLDEPLKPSPEAEPVLRRAGWSPEREVDISQWTESLRLDGNQVFPIAAEILRSYGGLSFRGSPDKGGPRHEFDVNPVHWYRERDRLEGIESVTGRRACPLGETSEAAMLAVLEDGTVVGDLDGCILQIAENWKGALDNLILGRGEDILLAEDYEPVEPRPWRP
jgi:hypothetical protein